MKLAVYSLVVALEGGLSDFGWDCLNNESLLVGVIVEGVSIGCL